MQRQHSGTDTAIPVVTVQRDRRSRGERERAASSAGSATWVVGGLPYTEPQVHRALLFDFAIGNASLKPRHSSFLGNVVDSYRLSETDGTYRVQLLEGHSDRVNREDIGPQLRRSRANSVAQVMLNLELPASRIGSVREAAGSMLIDRADSEAGRARNRSVVLEIAPASMGGAVQPPARPTGPTCGPDVGSQTSLAMDAANAYFRSLPHREKDQQCRHFFDGNGWDIMGLFVGAGSSRWTRRGRVGAACCQPRNERNIEDPNLCGSTVRINGQCSLSGTVNYIFGGRINRICRDYANSAENRRQPLTDRMVPER